jgi:hypothetical protein
VDLAMNLPWLGGDGRCDEVVVPSIEEDQRGADLGAGRLVKHYPDQNDFTEPQCHRSTVRKRHLRDNTQIRTSAARQIATRNPDWTDPT